MKLWDAVTNDVKSDVTWNRVVLYGGKSARAFPSVSAKYVVDKVPIVGWLPRYNYRWLLNDAVAGLTLGLMLIPQGLSYAKIAQIPVQYGLMSSWLPGAIYGFMGTSKDLSTGPTSLIGLITSEGVDALSGEYTPSQIASAMAMMMGLYGMVLGFFKLGFLLEFISLPILSGFISAVAITIALGQVGSLLGEKNVASSGAAHQIHDIFHQLPTANGRACAIGFGGIIFLVILEQAGKRWGTKNKFIWFFSVTRTFLCLVLFTGIGYAVNHNRSSKHYLFDVVQVKGSGIEHPQIPSTTLLGKVASRSIALFIGAAIEHTAIGRGFGVRNNYVVDQSQELCYIGVTNLFNSWFHAMGVGGAMSRTAVNSACKVKSPLGGFVTTAVVLVSIYKLIGTLYWIPKATLSAIIITAVWPLISSPVVFYRYWKTSLADFISCMIAFWVSLFVSTEYGIFASVGFNIVYYVLRQLFVRITSPTSITPSHPLDPPTSIPADTRLVLLPTPFFFPNAFHLKTTILDAVMTHHAPAYSTSHGSEAERVWSVAGEKRLNKLRKKAGVTDPFALPPITLLVLDFSGVRYIDTTAVMHLEGLMGELRRYAGGEIEVRFVGVRDSVRLRFQRAKWHLLDVDNDDSAVVDGDGEKVGGVEHHRRHSDALVRKPSVIDAPGIKIVRVYGTVSGAVTAPRRGGEVALEEVIVKRDGSDAGVGYAHDEKL